MLLTLLVIGLILYVIIDLVALAYQDQSVGMTFALFVKNTLLIFVIIWLLPKSGLM